MNNKIRTIEWQQDFSGNEPEVYEGKKPLPAVPLQGGKSLMPGLLTWSYKKGERTKVIEVKNSEGNCFLDVVRGHQISGIPDKAFHFVD